MADDLRAELDLDITRALQRVSQLEAAIGRASTGVRVDVDPSGIQEAASAARQLDDGLEDADDATQQLGKSAGSVKDQFERVRNFLVGGAIVKGLKSIVDVASDLEESSSKAATVFGDSFGQIEDFADGAAESVGLARDQAFEAVGTFGNLFTATGLAQDAAAEMSTGIVQLAADLASFNNIEVQEATEKLRAGLVGEAEPLRTLGVNITAAATEAKALELGLVGANGELDTAAKLQANYALILEQSTTAQGDFVRTSDGLANQTRIAQAEFRDLTAELGTALLPVAKELIEAARDELIPAIRDVGPALASVSASGGRAALATLEALLPVIEALAPALEVIADVLGALPPEVVALAGLAGAAHRGLRILETGLDGASAGAVGLKGKLVGGAALAAALLIVNEAAEALGESLGDALGTTLDDVNVEGLTNDLIALRDGLDDLENLDDLDLAFGQGGLNDLSDAIDRITSPSNFARVRDFTDSLLGPLGTDGTKDLRAAREGVEGLDQALTDIARTEGVEAASQALTALADSESLTADELERLLPLLDSFQVEVDRYGNEVQQAHQDQDAAAGSAGSLAGGLDDVGDAAGDAEREVEDLADALDRLVGRQLDVDSATAAFQDSLADLTEAAKSAREDGFGPTTDVLDETDAAARGVASAFRDATSDLLAQVEAADDAGASNFELARIIRDGIADLREQGDAADLTADQVNALAERYGLIPDELITELGLTGTDAVIEDLERLLGVQARVDRQMGIVVSTIPGGPGGRTENAAEGMIVEPRPGGTLVRVAEAGSREVIVPTDDPARAVQLLSTAGLLDVLRPTAIGAPTPAAGGGGRTAPLIERLTLPSTDPDRAGQKVLQAVNDAEFLYGDQGRFG